VTEPDGGTPVVIEGTTLWRMWRGHDPAAVRERAEHVLYSDSEVSGQLAVDGWPFVIRPTLARPIPGRVTRMAVVRIADSRPMSVAAAEPGGTGTAEAGFHGGASDDEVAALISLASGVRLRSGGLTRLWLENGDDEFGIPMEGMHTEPVWIGPGQWGSLLRDNVPDHLVLSAYGEQLGLFPRLSASNAATLVRAARLYADALWVADSDTNQAWLYLVSALEAAGSGGKPDTKGTRPVWARFQEQMPLVWAKLVAAGGDEHAQNIGTDGPRRSGQSHRSVSELRGPLQARAALDSPSA
jgi:hypothetical protein